MDVQVSNELSQADDPFPQWRTSCLWQEVPVERWRDWHWQYGHRIRSIWQLMELSGRWPAIKALLPPPEKLAPLITRYRVSVTPYFMSLADPTDPEDPILKQALPSLWELEDSPLGIQDPLDEEADMPVTGLTHRYPDRVLMVVTNKCAVYCRHCTRKRQWAVGELPRKKAELDRMLGYIRQHSEIRDVVVSGGDPLMMPLKRLEYVLGGLRSIPHVEIIRIGSRVPVTLPQRVTPELCDILDRYSPVWLNTQFNHPREVTGEAAEACDRLLRAGVPVSNQTVLLKGVNDDPDTMKRLNHELLRIKVRPYYLFFHCDPVEGATHFRTTIRKGLEIMECLRGHTSGLAVPTYVVDAPAGAGKIPLMPNYLISMSEESVILRNYEGLLVRCDEAALRVQPRPPAGVAGLLAGAGCSLIPSCNERIAARMRARSVPG